MSSSVGASIARATWIVQWLLIGSALFVIPQLFLPVGLGFNRSASLPRGLYWHESTPEHLHRGDRACFGYVIPDWAVARHYFPEGAQLCKVVLGLNGDRIVNHDGRISICPPSEPCIDAGQTLKADGRGRPVQGARLPDTVPVGFFYMSSTRVSNSFDSRYLGLIDAHRITRRIYPLVTER